jgi:aminoglycoside phosphotransferase (APT) family kinase protein
LKESGSRDRVVIITTDLDRHPAVRAWRALVSARTLGDARVLPPQRIEMLQRRRKSIVYRLSGLGPGGSDVIAKACRRNIAVVERDVYELLLRLAEGRVAGLGYYGFVPEPDGDSCWLFTEDAQGAPYDPTNAEHRALAAGWLAALHTASWRSGRAPGLPDRGPAHYRAHLQAARARILGSSANPVLSASERETLAGVVALLDLVDSRWDRVESCCDEMPRALVHGDFAGRNVRVRRNGGGTTLLAFDWEVAGWGLPAVDLSGVDLAGYWSCVREQWTGLEFATLERHASVGRLLRGGIAAMSWQSESLSSPWVEGAMCNLRIYRERIVRAMRDLAWHTPV